MNKNSEEKIGLNKAETCDFFIQIVYNEENYSASKWTTNLAISCMIV